MTRELTSHIEQIHDMLADGFGFLFRRASRTGHWHEPRSTALAAICLQSREDCSSPWLRTVREWIEEQQIRQGPAAGSWCEEIWDTAMCVLALKELGISSRNPAVENALNWIASLFSANGRGNWHDEPWETSWALIAILRSGRILSTLDVAEPIKWLISLQGQNGNIVAAHYSAYFVLIRHYSRKAHLAEEVRNLINSASSRCVSFLISSLSASDPQRLWTGEAWSNGQILWSLCASKAFPADDQALITKVTTWFRQTQGTDGSWLDIEDTASAIIGLLKLLQVVSVANGIKEEDAERDIERTLRKMVPVPKLHIRKPLIERERETGYVSINLPERFIKILLSVTAFLMVGLLSWIANLLQIYQGLFSK